MGLENLPIPNRLIISTVKHQYHINQMQTVMKMKDEEEDDDDLEQCCCRKIPGEPEK